MELIERIKQAESYRRRPYLDCCGKYWRECTCQNKGALTVGYGRNLDDVGVTLEEAALMTEHDIAVAVSELRKHFDWFDGLNRPRQDALIEMCFNLGITRFMGFHKMLNALDAGDFQRAAMEALNSKWHDDVGQRAERIALQLETGLVE